METHDLTTNMMAKIPKSVSNCESSARVETSRPDRDLRSKGTPELRSKRRKVEAGRALVNHNTPHPVFFGSVATKGVSISVSPLFATHPKGFQKYGI
jgi:hypothetical protein